MAPRLPVPPDYRALVELLVQRRHALGLTQEDVAAAGGFADGHMNKLEAFHRIAQLPTLQLWAATLGLEMTFELVDLPCATQRVLESRSAPPRRTTRTRRVVHDRAG